MPIGGNSSNGSPAWESPHISIPTIAPGLINRVLPVEIMTEILSLVTRRCGVCDCCSPSLRMDRYPSKHRKNLELTHPLITSIPAICCSTAESPLIISQVCSSWRHIVLKTSSMWSEIFVGNPSKAAARLVDLWVQRSGNHRPISVDIYQMQMTEGFEEAFDILSSRSERWKSCLIEIDFEQHWPAIIPPSLPTQFLQSLTSTGALPLLQTADLNVQLPNHSTANNLVDAILRAPRLHTLQWAFTDAFNVPTSIVIPQFSQVRCVTLTICFECQLEVGELSKLRRLEELCVVDVASDSSDVSFFPPSNSATIVLPELLALSLDIIDWSISLMHAITVPQLRRLTIAQHPSIEFNSWPALNRMLVRSAPSLETLDLQDLDDEDIEHVVELLGLSSLSLLVELSIRGFDLSNHLIEFLVSDVGDQATQRVVLPNLKTLDIGSFMATDGVVSTMLAKRFRSMVDGRRCLSQAKVTLIGDGAGYTRDVRTLEALQKDGFDVELHFI